MRVHLLELDLMQGDGDSKAIKNQEARACGPLIDGTNVPVLQFFLVLLRYMPGRRLSIDLVARLSGVFRRCHFASNIGIRYGNPVGHFFQVMPVWMLLSAVAGHLSMANFLWKISTMHH